MVPWNEENKDNRFAAAEALLPATAEIAVSDDSITSLPVTWDLDFTSEIYSGEEEVEKIEHAVAYEKYGYAITGIKCREAILESEDGFTTSTSIPRDKLIRTQTPQTFRLKNIIAAHEAAKERGINNSVASCTLMAEIGDIEMHIVPGSEKNIKITTVEDLEILKALMNVKAETWSK